MWRISTVQGKDHLQHPCGKRNSTEGSAQATRHEHQVLVSALLNRKCLLGRERLYGQTDRRIQDAVQDVERPPLQIQLVPVCQVVYAAAQDVVFGDDFLDVECIFDPLQAMCRRTTVEKSMRDCLV